MDTIIGYKVRELDTDERAILTLALRAQLVGVVDGRVIKVRN